MVAVTTYTVTAERGSRRWLLQCEELPGALSEVARLDQADAVMREAIAFVARVPETEIDIELRPTLPGDVGEELTRAHQLRDRANALEQEATQHRLEVARALREQGLTVRDIGTLLGVTYQRAHQLIHATATTTAA